VQSELDYAGVLLLVTLTLFGVSVLTGLLSKTGAYVIGALGSACGIALSLFVLLANRPVLFQLWSITPTSSVQISVSLLSSYFLLISCLVWLGACVYSVDYDDDYPRSLASLLLLTMLSMIVILVSADAVLFLIGWELMTISSFFMILQGKGNRKGILNAAFLFLAFGEGSSVFIMLAFSGIFASTHSLDFSLLASTPVTGWIASWIFVAALIGFGLKMGIAPFHMSEWLPIAHSSAPSNASALLSATLTLMGVYGLINIVTNLAPYQLWWGWLALSIGGISAMLGALFASASEHAKGLPAYSTIENNGLIVVGIGAFILASYYHITLLADLALIAALYHSFSHSISKGSLFLLMGWLSKVKGSFDLSRMSAAEAAPNKRAIHFGGFFTVLSLSAVPPLAGFVSEWLILEVLFQSFRYGDVGSQIIGTLVGATAALAAGIVIIAMTKVYGFGVLWSKPSGQGAIVSEEGKIKHCREISESALYFALMIIGVGVLAPAIFLLASDATAPALHGNVFQTFVTGALGVPKYFVIVSGNPFGGFSPTFTAIFLSVLLVVPFLISQFGSRWHIRKTTGWFAGLPQPNARDDIYNSFGYSTPIRLMLKFLFRTRENIVHVGGVQKALLLTPEEYIVDLEVLDVFKRVYDILFGKWLIAFSSFVGRKFMPGKLSYYLIYIMLALIFVMAFVLVAVI
jgi:hydrogenase-4 component B